MPIKKVYAIPLSRVSCEASMSTNTITIGNAVTSANIGNVTINATLNYSCRSTILSGYVSICLAVNGGDNNPTVINPRYMINRSDNTSTLPFNMTVEGRTLGTLGAGSAYKAPPLYLPGLFSGSPTISGSVPITVSLVANANGTLATAGLYTNVFRSGSATLTYDADTDQNIPNCLIKPGNIKQIETFTVQATVIPSCEITATSDINLGSHSAGTTSIAGNNPNAIGVKCTNGAPYNIGLAPSNGNVNGTGVMSGTNDNPDKVSYQLLSSTGLNGKKWGNTATSTSVGNGVTGTGTGAVQTQPVYVTVPNVDFKPDNYSDTVTITVNY